MEITIFIIAIGLIGIFNIIALSVFHSYISKVYSQTSSIVTILLEHMTETAKILSDQITAEHRKTRKETQEEKTRLTQVRKDLNNMEMKLNKLLPRKIGRDEDL